MVDTPFISDDTFLSAFNDCSAPPSAFNHVGHLRIGWIHLQRYPVNDAIRLTCDGIERFANHLGVPGKYNQTLTIALMRLMASGGASDTNMDWETFLSTNHELIYDAKGLLARYYSEALLNSAEAKSGFVSPDLAPLP